MAKRPLPIDVEPETEAPEAESAEAGQAGADESHGSEAEDVVVPPYPPVVAAILAAGIFLTRLPLPLNGTLTPELFGRSMGWFPLIGAGIGLGAGLAFGVLCGFGVPSLVGGALVVALMVVTTGGLHEDGLADSADGLGARGDRDQRLEVMRDSRSGAFGVLALVFSVGLRAAALAALPGGWRTNF